MQWRTIYLDHHHWVKLDRTRIGAKGREPYRAALDALVDAIDHGNVITPLCGMRYIENQRRRDEASRLSIGNLMIRLSRLKTVK